MLMQVQEKRFIALRRRERRLGVFRVRPSKSYLYTLLYTINSPFGHILSTSALLIHPIHIPYQDVPY